MNENKNSLNPASFDNFFMSHKTGKHILGSGYECFMT